jgi:hypothetical protein
VPPFSQTVSRAAMVAGGWAAVEVHVMSQGTRATLFAALLGLALSGPAGSFRLMEGIQAWMSSLWADSGGAQVDAGGIMNPDGGDGAQVDEGGIMDPDG